MGTVTFNFTGGDQSFTIPAGVTTVTIMAVGGKGGDSGSISGGTGASVTAQCNVVPGEELIILVAEAGQSASSANFGGGGGGGSCVFRGSITPENLLVVAGGGGGAGSRSSTGNPAHSKPDGSICSVGSNGKGIFPGIGGVRGNSGTGGMAGRGGGGAGILTSGILAIGGIGDIGGGGGGGFSGGGGGSGTLAAGGGGGGGSAIGADCVLLSFNPTAGTGNGQVSITFEEPATTTTKHKTTTTTSTTTTATTTTKHKTTTTTTTSTTMTTTTTTKHKTTTTTSTTTTATTTTKHKTTTTTTTTTSTTTTTTTTTQCPIANPQTCCQVVVEFKTQLVPPALATKDITTEVFFSTPPVVEDVCPEKVIICGVLTKKIMYTAVDEQGNECPKVICDERPFQCYIDRDDANEGDTFKICGFAILCEGTPRPQNEGTRPGPGGIGSVPVIWKITEKDIVKVCIRKEDCTNCNPLPPACP